MKHILTPDEYWAIARRKFPPRASAEVAPLLYSIAKFCGARKTLEVGVAECWTSYALGLHARETYGGHHTGVDIHPQPIERLKLVAKEYDLPVTGICANSATIEWKTPLDILYIDGGHSYEQVKADIENLAKFAKLVIFHDYWKNAEVKKAVDEYCTPFCFPHGTGLALWQRN